MTKTIEEAFRRLTIGDEAALVRMLEGSRARNDAGPPAPLPARVLALIRIGALIAVDAPWPSYRREIAAAMEDGLGLDDLLAVLIAVAEQAGSARVIAAAPRIATAAGYDIEEELDRPALPGAGR